jgi:hypothetical protein
VTGKKGKGPVKPMEPPRGIAFPIECVTDDCDSHTMLIHPGNAPFEAGMFLDLGWVAMSDPGERDILYMCPRCIARAIVEVDQEMAKSRRDRKVKVSG